MISEPQDLGANVLLSLALGKAEFPLRYYAINAENIDHASVDHSIPLSSMAADIM